MLLPYKVKYTLLRMLYHTSGSSLVESQIVVSDQLYCSNAFYKLNTVCSCQVRLCFFFMEVTLSILELIT